METMHPTMVRGLSGYRSELTPPAELDERMAAVRSWLEQEGLDAALVYGDPRQYGRLCYLTGMVPMSRWAAVLVPRRGAPRLLAAVSGSRDLPFMRTLSYIDDVVPVGDLAEQIPALAGSAAKVGLITESGIPSRVYRALRAADQVREVTGDFLDSRMRNPTEMELAQLRSLTALARSVADEIISSYTDGAAPSAALIAGEKLARERRAHDVRMLVSVDRGQTLQPFDRPMAANPDVMVFYLAIEAAGYWARVFQTAHRALQDPTPAVDVDRSLRAGIEAIGAQRSAAEVIDALRTPGPGLTAHELIDERHLVRLGLWSPADVVVTSGSPLPRGIYSHRAGARSDSAGAISSRTVEVRDEGAKPLD